jgi:hypothetical protein
VMLFDLAGVLQGSGLGCTGKSDSCLVLGADRSAQSPSNAVS